MTRRLCVVVAAAAFAMTACDSRVPLSFPSGPTPAQTGAVGPPQPVLNGPRLLPAVAIALGQTVTEAIESSDARCFPAWDATGRCRQYEVTVAADSTLIATLVGSSPSRGEYNTELFLVTAEGDWRDATHTWPERQVSMPAKSGQSFRLLVLSYGPFPDAFEIRADARP